MFYFITKSLELRAPFLDHFFTAYYFSLPPEKRAPTDRRLEKHVIRKAFNGQNVIPQEMIWQPNIRKSEGISHTSYLPNVLKKHADLMVRFLFKKYDCAYISTYFKYERSLMRNLKMQVSNFRLIHRKTKKNIIIEIFLLNFIHDVIILFLTIGITIAMDGQRIIKLHWNKDIYRYYAILILITTWI